MPSRRKPKAVGCHVFSSGFNVGLEPWFDIQCLLEDLGLGKANWEHNRPDIPWIQGIDDWPLEELRDKRIDLVYGNPPCSGFSVVSAGYRGIDAPINICMKQFIAAALTIEPKVFIFESVPSAATTGYELMEQFAIDAEAKGYKTIFLFVNAMWHAVPQKRPRFFLVGFKREIPLWFAPPRMRGQTTVGDAIGDLTAHLPWEKTSGKPIDHVQKYRAKPKTAYQRAMRLQSPGVMNHWRERWDSDEPCYPHLDQGQGIAELDYDQLSDYYKKARDAGKSFSFHTAKRIRWNTLSTVVMGGFRHIHPIKDRMLTVRESARLMSIPDRFVYWENRPDKQQADVGKAIPRLVGSYVGWNIYRTLMGRPAPGPAQEDLFAENILITTIDYRRLDR